MKTMICFLLTASLLLASCAAPASESDAAVAASSQAASVSQPQPVPQAGVTLPAAVSKVYNGVTVSVHPAIEMLSVVQYLSDYGENYPPLITQLDLPYKQEIDAYFEKFRAHEAIAFINENAAIFAYDLPPGATLFLDEQFRLDRESYQASGYPERTGVDMEAYARVMQSFYEETNFAEFFGDHTAYYHQMIDTTIDTFPDWNMIEKMEAFYGKQMDSYHLILVSLFHPGGFGATLNRADGTAIYSIMGPGSEEAGIPSFGSEEGFSELVLHEFGHAFIPISEGGEIPEIRKAVEDSAYLMEPIQQQMQQSAYSNWSYAYEELVLRGAVVRLMGDNQSSDAAELMKYEYDVGFIYIEDVVDILAQYVANRDSYPVFDDFLPVLTQQLMKRNPV